MLRARKNPPKVGIPKGREAPSLRPRTRTEAAGDPLRAGGKITAGPGILEKHREKKKKNQNGETSRRTAGRDGLTGRRVKIQMKRCGEEVSLEVTESDSQNGGGKLLLLF